MNDFAIQVEDLGKRYRIGLAEETSDTLFGSLGRWVRSPLQNFRQLRSLSNFHEEEARDIIWALRDVSFQVNHGEVLGIVGHNGAGKSTLLKILSRITPPTEGKILLNGRVASLLEVGTGFHPELTGRENVYLNGTILGMTRREVDRRFDEIVDFSGVEAYIDTPVKRYSSGMRVRLAFAVAAHLEPEILLIDEVLSVGDAAFQRKSLGKMNEVARQGRTALFVSHNMRAVSNLTQNCLLLNNGQLQAYGPTQQVINTYMAMLTEANDEGGMIDLANLPRPEMIQTRTTYARFEWLRLTTAEGMATDLFHEGDPITIECGIKIAQPFNEIQLGCSVGTADDHWLFTVPSQQLNGRFSPGDYIARLVLDPNPLRTGLYIVTLKLFADGIRHDHLERILQFSIESFLAETDNPAYSYSWVAGPLRFDYPWEIELQPPMNMNAREKLSADIKAYDDH